jgi:hypothetical protein
MSIAMGKFALPDGTRMKENGTSTIKTPTAPKLVSILKQPTIHTNAVSEESSIIHQKKTNSAKATE